MKGIEQLPLAGNRVFIRVDFNAPVKNGRITDATRIRAALKTIRYAVDQGAKVILASHRGRPGGKPVPELTLGPIAEQLAEELGQPVRLLPDCVGPEVEAGIAAMKPGDVVLVPDPSYPIHAFGFLMAGGVIREVPADPTPEFAQPRSRSSGPGRRNQAPRRNLRG